MSVPSSRDVGVEWGMKGRHKDNVLLGREEPASPQELEMIMKQYSSTLKPRVV